MHETTALGAAIAAGFAAGIWKDFEELRGINREDHTIFKPQISQQESEYMYKRWEKAVEMARGWMQGAQRVHDQNR